MASSQSPNRVYFTSFDRQVTDSNTDFSITFDTPIQNAYNFEVVGASLPNLFKPFAPYETIFYFYHEDFQDGNTAIGVPLSLTAFPSRTAEASPPAGRDTYIDKRYFSDGTDLASYIEKWLQSYSTSFPSAGEATVPFYYPNDDPTQDPIFFANQAATGVTFSNLTVTFDDLTSDGTLKLTFADSTSQVVRVASSFDFGDLRLAHPSQLGFKLGYTSSEAEAFDAGGLAVVTTANNIFQVTITKTSGAGNTVPVSIPANDYSYPALASAIETALLNRPNQVFEGTTVTEAGGILTFNFATSFTSVASFTLVFASTAQQQACKTLLGFVNDNTTVTIGNPIVAPNAIGGTVQVPTPASHTAPDPINLIRTSTIYFASSLSSGESLASAGRKDILFTTALTAGIGQIQLYQSTLSGIVINRPPSIIRNLRLTLLDDNFQVMEALPQNASITVEIHFAYNEDKKASQQDSRSLNLYA